MWIWRVNLGASEKTQEELRESLATVQHQKQLITNLEEDLMMVQTLQRPEVEGADDAATLPVLPVEVVGRGISIDETVTDPEKSKGGAAESLLPIVSSQRERFRYRVQELEEQNLQYQQHMALLQSEIEKMRGDNVKLYEKIKFLQSYAGSKSRHAGDDTEARYSTQYEASLDPFRRFNISERQRTYMALRTHDKATLSIGRVIMSSSRARAIFFVYLLILHLLVFLVLYRLAYTESCKRDALSDCAEKFKEHMQMVHGDHNDAHFHG